MARDLADLEADALKLEPEARARLAEAILRSLDEISETDHDRLWAEEALRRDQDLDGNPSAARPGPDVLREARSRLP